MTSLLDALDFRHLPEAQRERINHDLLPSLVNPLSEMGIEVRVHYELKPFLAYKQQSGALTLPALSEYADPPCSISDTRVMTAEHDGEVIGIVGARLIWCEDSLADALSRMVFPGEYWKIVSPIATGIKCVQVVFRSGAEIDEAWRGLGIFKRMSRLFDLLLLGSGLNWTWRAAVIRKDKQDLGWSLYDYPMATAGVIRVTPSETVDYRLFLEHRSDAKARLIGAPVGHWTTGATVYEAGKEPFKGDV